ncbi:unnamed protein product [Pylaiella littoralis]
MKGAAEKIRYTKAYIRSLALLASDSSGRSRSKAGLRGHPGMARTNRMRRLAASALLHFFLGRISNLFVEADTFTTAEGVTIAGGLFHTCAIVSDLTLRCWGGGSADGVLDIVPSGSVENGYGNFGQLGTGNNATLGDEDGEMGDSLPVVDLGSNTVQEVAAGQSHTCVLLTSGDVACWGYNEYGQASRCRQLGVGNTTHRGLSPNDMGDGLALVDLGTGRTATQIDCGQYNTCAVLDDGSLKCWGRNNYGMLGLGDTENRGEFVSDMGDNLPAVDLGTGQTAVAVAGGQYHTCAILGSGGLKCWGGKNETGLNYGQLGQENTLDIGSSPGQMGDNLTEIDLGTGRTALAVATGWFHTCVILDNFELHCFGRNFDGQLGLGDQVDRGAEPGDMGDNMVAVDLGVGRYPVAVTAGRWHTCVVMDNDEIKCFGANTVDDMGAGQLGLEDTDNRGITLATTGDALESVELGTGRVSGWVFAMFDHNCVIFSDAAVKCWGLNKSGQLGVEDTVDRGDIADSMGDSLPTVTTGLRVAFPPAVSFDVDAVVDEEEGSGLSTELQVVVYLIGATGAFFVVGAFCLFCRRRLESKGMASTRTSGVDAFAVEGAEKGGGSGGVELERGMNKLREVVVEGEAPLHTATASKPPRPKQTQALISYPPSTFGDLNALPTHSSRASVMSGREVGMAAAGTAGMVVAGGINVGWNVLGVVAENLPWIGVAYHMLNEIADIVDTKNAMEGNMAKIRSWAISLQDVLLQMGKQMQSKPAVNARALEHMSRDVVSTLQELVDAVASYNAKGALAQYTSSRSCQKAVDAADTALRGALVKLSVGQGAELITMVGRLEGAGMVMDEKLDMIIEHLRKQEEKAERLELRLAEYSESMAEVLGQYAIKDPVNDSGRGQPSGKTVAQLGKEKLDQLQISEDAVSYPSKLPFASGTYSEVYQVIHGGVVKAAKKTNLARLGVGGQNDVNRVFKRFVKELYILSQMHSDRVVSVFGAIASPTELTLVMEFVERGSIRTILNDDAQRMALTPTRQQGLLADTAAGMTYLYDNGVAHRDLKSANCLVTHDWRVKITDFGLSETTDAISTGTESNVNSSFRGGTMVYMAPELLSGGTEKEVPPELSDVYSFGVVVWDVVCGAGQTPWADVRMNDLPKMLKSGKRLVIPPDIGRFYRKLMLNCWRDDPHRRPKFDRVLHSITAEAESTFSATPALSTLKEMPLGPTRTDFTMFGSAPGADRTAATGISPMIYRQTRGAPPGYEASAFREAGSAFPPPSSRMSAPATSAQLRTNGVDSAPTHLAMAASRGKSPGSAFVGREYWTSPARAAATTTATSNRAELEMGRSASVHALGTPMVPHQQQQQYERTNSEDSIMRKAKALSRGGARRVDKAQAAGQGAASGRSSAPGDEVPRPAADHQESGQLEGRENPVAAKLPRRVFELNGPRVRERSSDRGGEARAGVEPGGAAGEERGSRSREGRQRDPGRVRPKKNRIVQVVHGFRLTSPARDEREA